MAIVAGDIDFFLSGGGANSDVDASIGGAKSSTEVTAASLNNLFDDVTGQESFDGDTEYRCVYVHNSHGSLALQSAFLWIKTISSSTDTSFALALDGVGLNGTAEGPVADEDTAPSGESFSSVTSKGTGLSLGNIPAGQHYAFWIRRVVAATASAFNTDTVVFRVEGDTAA